MEAELAALFLTILMIYHNKKLYQNTIKDPMTRLLYLVTIIAASELIWSAAKLPKVMSLSLLKIAAAVFYCAIVLVIPQFCHFVLRQMNLSSPYHKMLCKVLGFMILAIALLTVSSPWTHAFYSVQDDLSVVFNTIGNAVFIAYTVGCAANALSAIGLSYLRSRQVGDKELNAMAKKLFIFCVLLAGLMTAEIVSLQGNSCHSLPMVIALLYLTIQMNTEKMLSSRETAAVQETEMGMAKRIQMGMLPKNAETSSEYDLATYMQPAKNIGGDFFDFYKLDEDHIVLTIADVSGKSIPAALFMAVSKSILKNSMCTIRDPAKVFRQVNEQLEPDNPESMFVTAWTGVVDLSSGKMICVNAGHEYPAIRQKGGTFEIYKDRHGLPLAAMTGVRYRSYELQLKPGDTILVYTDGIPEAKNGSGEFLGMDRFEEILKKAPSRPEDILALVKTEVDHFVKKEPQFDDFTMLCFRYNGPAEKPEEDASEDLAVSEERE